MPTRIQPGMDLQLNAAGMGPSMMKLDTGAVVTPIEELVVPFGVLDVFDGGVTIADSIIYDAAPRPTRRQRLWALLNMNVTDVWTMIRVWWSSSGD